MPDRRLAVRESPAASAGTHIEPVADAILAEIREDALKAATDSIEFVASYSRIEYKGWCNVCDMGLMPMMYV